MLRDTPLRSEGDDATRETQPPGNGTRKPLTESDPTPRVSSIPSMATQAAPRRGLGFRGPTALELLAVFAIGVTVMNFIYIDPRGVPRDQIGVPGFDAFYHVKMAVMLPKIGLVDDFPWLRYVYFSQLDGSFISHHYGFHVLLSPFVYAGRWLAGDYLTGGRWAVSTFFGMTLTLFHALLIHQRIGWRWFWLVMFLLLPAEFFGRHAFVRAISPSLMFMLLIMLLAFSKRYVWTGVAVAAYCHLYLGSVVYTPMLIGLFAVASLLGPRGDRRFPWRLVLWTTLGWLVGLRTYPYFNGALEFLRMQILGTGLDPDIPVGSEWNSYGDVWRFAVKMCGPLLAVWTAALVLRVRLGPRLNARETTLLLINFALLFLTFKAKRFIEYWPAFCLLSAAFLAAPILNPLAAWFDPTGEKAGVWKRAAIQAVLAAAVCAGVLGAVHVVHPEGIENFTVETSVWSLLATALVLATLVRIWLVSSTPYEGRRGAIVRVAAFWLIGAAFAGALVLLKRREFGTLEGLTAKLSTGVWGWLLLVGVYAVVTVRARPAAVTHRGPGFGARLLSSATILSTGGAVVGVVVLLCADRLVALQRNVYCGYNLPAIRSAMDYLKEVSQPGDIVFTDDWDVFPVYFYHNAYNNYIVGLDPKFTHTRKPELWERFVKITRAQVPRTFQARWTGPDGREVRRKMHVELTDIRDFFNAGYVIVDSDHKHFARKLAEAPEFTELIYPKTRYDDCRDAPYLIFKVRDPVTKPTRSAAGDDDGIIYLSELDPVSAEQGWGSLTFDRSVSGEPIQLQNRFYVRGLGSHAPHELTFAIPPRYSIFEATVGIDSATDGRGSVIVWVEVDGQERFRSDVLTGDGEPVHIRVPVALGQRLTLRADTTADGDRFDHVDWAMARFVRATGSTRQ